VKITCGDNDRVKCAALLSSNDNNVQDELTYFSQNQDFKSQWWKWKTNRKQKIAQRFLFTQQSMYHHHSTKSWPFQQFCCFQIHDDDDCFRHKNIFFSPFDVFLSTKLNRKKIITRHVDVDADNLIVIYAPHSIH
jgi:hypothetical protein